MKPAPSTSRACLRSFHRTCRQHRQTLETIQASSQNADAITQFRDRAFAPQKPIVFRNTVTSPTTALPAFKSWFVQEGGASSISTRLEAFQTWPFPYELMSTTSSKRDTIALFRDWLVESSDITDQVLAGILQAPLVESKERRFFQLYAPLKLLAKALEFNQLQATQNKDVIELYIAQSSLSDLPRELQQDLVAPDVVRQVGKGDIYSSSIWLGTEPTYTPLHRDPNPNLFCQLKSQKAVRLLPPELGDAMFFQVQVRLRQQSNSRIRTSEMMEGEEREVLHDMVWKTEEPSEQMCDIELDPGDALFIPQGWWHSVKSLQSAGGLNASVNWWFR